MTLPVSSLITVTINLAAQAAQASNLNTLLVLGSTDNIDTNARFRVYGNLTAVGMDFQTTDPEYGAAQAYFAQAPKPATVVIGRWAQAATAGRLNGGSLTAAQQALSNFTAITAGSFSIAKDGAAATNITGVNLSGATSLANVASILQGALTGVTVTYDSVRSRFIFKSSTTGASSAVSYLGTAGTGTDISALLLGTAATGASTVQGIVAESAAQAVTILSGYNNWYAVVLAATTVADADRLGVAAVVEALDPPRMFGYTSGVAAALDPNSTTDIFYQMKTLSYRRTFGQYSSSSPHAVASALGRMLTTNFAANNTVINLMYKQEPGVAAENLTLTQANALAAKNGNVFATYDNGANIIQYGAMASGDYIDEIYGTDAMKQGIQAALFNALVTAPTKIPQTDQGNQILGTVIDAQCATFVANGLLAPGVWNQAGFGNLAQGDTLNKGYYIYQPPVATQSSADRAARKSVAFTVAAKLAGAINSASVVINVTR